MHQRMNEDGTVPATVHDLLEMLEHAVEPSLEI